MLLSARCVLSGGKAYGLDAAPDMITLAQENGVQAVTNAEFLHGRIEDIPFPDGHVTCRGNCMRNGCTKRISKV